MGGLWFEVGVWGGRSHEWTASPVAGRKPLRHSVLRYLCSGLVRSGQVSAIRTGIRTKSARREGRGWEGSRVQRLLGEAEIVVA